MNFYELERQMKTEVLGGIYQSIRQSTGAPEGQTLIGKMAGQNKFNPQQFANHKEYKGENLQLLVGGYLSQFGIDPMQIKQELATLTAKATQVYVQMQNAKQQATQGQVSGASQFAAQAQPQAGTV